jgi:hypothetical protein
VLATGTDFSPACSAGFTVLGISKNSEYMADKYMLEVSALSTYLSCLGSVCGAWFGLRYAWADGHDFKVFVLH